MSWRSEKLKSLTAYTIVIIVIAMLVGVGIGYLTDHLKTGGLVGLGIGCLYFLVGFWIIFSINRDMDRIITAQEKKLADCVRGPKPPDR